MGRRGGERGREGERRGRTYLFFGNGHGEVGDIDQIALDDSNVGQRFAIGNLFGFGWFLIFLFFPFGFDLLCDSVLPHPHQHRE